MGTTSGIEEMEYEDEISNPNIILLATLRVDKKFKCSSLGIQTSSVFE